jgi:hypothetical protein
MNKQQQLTNWLTEDPTNSHTLLQKLYQKIPPETLTETLAKLTTTDQTFTPEKLINSLDETTINYLHTRYVHNPTRRLRQWSLIFLSLMLGWALWGGLSHLKPWL